MSAETSQSIETSESHRLQCMEIWGGNQAVSTAVAMPGMDAWIYSQPDAGAESGGDVHYASSCATGALTRVLLADVAGHGSSVADTARRLRKLMQRHINQHTQTRFVRAMNREFAGMTELGVFATAIALSYDAPINRLQFCNAGHPPPLVRRAATGEWSYLQFNDRRAQNFPLGIDDVADYDEFESPIAVGDLILCYTDALPEARREDGTMLESTGLLEMAARVDPADPSQFIPNLLQEIQTVAKVNDDLTMLLLRPNGNRPYVPLGDKLLAPFKVLRAVATSYV
jgi:serine phosphatase RsbU (regulator of sigma subunit)